MNSTLSRDKATESYTKLNVFERLTMKKGSSGADPVLKSSISIKPKLLISCTTPVCRSTVGPRNT